MDRATFFGKVRKALSTGLPVYSIYAKYYDFQNKKTIVRDLVHNIIVDEIANPNLIEIINKPYQTRAIITTAQGFYRSLVLMKNKDYRPCVLSYLDYLYLYLRCAPHLQPATYIEFRHAYLEPAYSISPKSFLPLPYSILKISEYSDINYQRIIPPLMAILMIGIIKYKLVDDLVDYELSEDILFFYTGNNLTSASSGITNPSYGIHPCDVPRRGFYFRQILLYPVNSSSYFNTYSNNRVRLIANLSEEIIGDFAPNGDCFYTSYNPPIIANDDTYINWDYYLLYIHRYTKNVDEQLEVKVV